MSLSTPVVFIIFNRPDLTDLVFQKIAEAQPTKLLVIADGPRFAEEAEKCSKTREILKRVDWDCDVLTNFSDKNLGCRERIVSGLNWVFSIVEEAIILEDDCLPAPSFFTFCQALLEYYRHDERIMMISGDNFQLGQSRTNYSYYFSKYAHIWGWATWRRAWHYYDANMETWPECREAISSLIEDNYEKKFWIDRFDHVFNLRRDWDWQWAYACLTQNGLSVMPNVNLISNLGFREDATQALHKSPWAKLPVDDIWEIKHPPNVIRNATADKYTFDYHYEGNNMRKCDTFNWKLYNYFTNILKKNIKKVFNAMSKI